MKKLLIINANIDRARSRTCRLTNVLVRELLSRGLYDASEELVLENETILPLDTESVRRRDALLAEGKTSDEMFRYAHMLAGADGVVFSAPYWEFSFPAKLNLFLEQATVAGVTYRYGENGPLKTCRADTLYFVTTSGGYIGENNCGYDKLRALADLYGMESTRFFSAEGLDIDGNDVESIMREAEKRLIEML